MNKSQSRVHRSSFYPSGDVSHTRRWLPTVVWNFRDLVWRATAQKSAFAYLCAEVHSPHVSRVYLDKEGLTYWDRSGRLAAFMYPLCASAQYSQMGSSFSFFFIFVFLLLKRNFWRLLFNRSLFKSFLTPVIIISIFYLLSLYVIEKRISKNKKIYKISIVFTKFAPIFCIKILSRDNWKFFKLCLSLFLHTFNIILWYTYVIVWSFLFYTCLRKLQIIIIKIYLKNILYV